MKRPLRWKRQISRSNADEWGVRRAPCKCDASRVNLSDPLSLPFDQSRISLDHRQLRDGDNTTGERPRNQRKLQLAVQQFLGLELGVADVVRKEFGLLTGGGGFFLLTAGLQGPCQQKISVIGRMKLFCVGICCRRQRHVSCPLRHHTQADPGAYIFRINLHRLLADSLAHL